MKTRLVREIICGINSCNTKFSNLELTKKVSLKSRTIQIWRQWILPNFKDLPPPVLLRPKPFLPLEPGRPSLNEAPLTYTPHSHTCTHIHTHAHTHTHTHTHHPPQQSIKSKAVWLWTNEIKAKAKPSHITLELTTRSIVRFSPQTMQWYH